MGRKALFDVKSLKIGQKLPFPNSKKKFIYQYLNNFNRQNEEREYKKIEVDSKIFIERVA